MNLISEYVREEKKYSKEDLKTIFRLNNDEVGRFIRKLKLYGVLKVINITSKQKDLNDLIEDEIVNLNIDIEEYYYIFKFVGILTVGNIIIKCFPKYLLKNQKPLNEMKQVLKVLRKYNSQEQRINAFNGSDNNVSFNLLSTIIYLLDDYNENGVYSNQQNIIETNGDGEILWDNTINETFPIISNNRPFYTQLQTTNTVNNELDYFSRLHAFVITDCCRKLKEANLLELFEIEDILLSEEDISEFGNIDYILYKINNELNLQFVTRKQMLLKTLYAYLSYSESLVDNFGLSMYGTNSFNLVWEKVCSVVFNNKLSKKLQNLKLPVKLHKDYIEKKEKTLLEIIEKPSWICFDNQETYKKKAKDTLIPDIICLYQKEDSICFGIFDAKYYNIILQKNKLDSYPGIGDVTKQYLYQLAYNDFILKHKFKSVQNAFFMPTDNEEPILNGEVEMNILKGLSDPPLTNILVVKLPAHQIYEYYLKGKHLDIHKEYSFL